MNGKIHKINMSNVEIFINGRLIKMTTSELIKMQKTRKINLDEEDKKKLKAIISRIHLYRIKQAMDETPAYDVRNDLEFM